MLFALYSRLKSLFRVNVTILPVFFFATRRSLIVSAVCLSPGEILFDVSSAPSPGIVAFKLSPDFMG